MKRVIVLSVAISLLQGCALLASPKEQPVIEDSVGNRITDFSRNKIGTLATTPERRVVVIKMPDNKFCAEPSPDVAESLFSTFKVIAEAKPEASPATAKIDAEKNLTTAANRLFVRSQGVQLFRDGLYSLCQANLNGAISDAQYKDMFERILTMAGKLIAVEIPSIHATQTEDVKSSVPDVPKVGTDVGGESKTNK